MTLEAKDDLELIDGAGQAMFREPAWHRLGTVVGDNFGWAEAVAANLSVTFGVEKVAISELISTLNPFDINGPDLRAQDDEYATVRSDGLILQTGLGQQHTVFHASEGYAFGQCIREQGEKQGIKSDLRSLGTIDRGRKWFMTFDLGTFQIGDYDVNDYMSVNGSYDSSWKLGVLSSEIVQVCANTIALSKRFGVTHYGFKHTSGIFDRVEEAKKAIARHAANRAAFQALGDQLVETRVSAQRYANIVEALFPVNDDVPTKTRNVNSDAQSKVRALYLGEVGPNVVQGVEGTGWAVVQAVNTYENWGTPIRKTAGRGEATTRALRQVEAVVDGKQPLTDQALELVLAN
jgi:phage/plasmid-like protein (TIGR03299 family)